MTGQSQRRERLCALLWDIPDDPRAALRWSLSKLRSLVDEPGKPRIVADRESVTFDITNVHVDALAVQAWFPNGIEELATKRLRLAAASFRGEFLEGLALSECHEFQGWLVAERERIRTLQVNVLNTIVDHLAGDAEEALPFVRTLVQVDPYDDAAWAKLVHLLVASGHRREAEQQLEAAKRLLKELGPGNAAALDKASRTVRDGWDALELTNGTRHAPRPSSEVRAKAESPQSSCFGKPAPLVGRSREWSMLLAAVDEAQAQGRERVILLTGEPGVG
jgi:DNA-binding SARP family transcriptional activator